MKLWLARFNLHVTPYMGDREIQRDQLRLIIADTFEQARVKLEAEYESDAYSTTYYVDVIDISPPIE